MADTRATQRPSPAYEIGLCCSSPWERATDDPPDTALPSVTKQCSKAVPDPGLGAALLALCGWEGGLQDEELQPYTCSAVEHSSLKPHRLFILSHAAVLSTLSLNPLVLMDGPVKASQDAGNRITANQILDREGEEEKKSVARSS
ncbi:unnamed protein product [Pleuronectes platessa]|uniref:Uncharacterized protein n=1 Tax=Pleuronectes platessa TaxID=8262 RepID=A0A9N7TTY8_PLEPL|nr:unnamed protein product [Pleuronectes platessa]